MTQESAPKVKMIAPKSGTRIPPKNTDHAYCHCSCHGGLLPAAPGRLRRKNRSCTGRVYLPDSVLYLVQPWDMVLSTLMVPVAGYFLGFWDWSVDSTSTGTSSFVSMFALSVVSAGAATTPLGRRIALIFLRKFHDKPLRMVFAVSIVSAALSAFISNTAVIIMMSGIVNGLLITMGEKPGESKLAAS